MSTPAIAAVCLVLVSLAFFSVRFWRAHRRWRLWLKRDMAMTQAFHDYLQRGEIEEAREIRQEMKRNFDKVFNPQN